MVLSKYYLTFGLLNIRRNRGYDAAGRYFF